MKVAIIGLGLMGGSFGLALKKRSEEYQIFGWDHDPVHLSKAVELGLIDQGCNSLKEAIDQSDWIYLSVPVNVIEDILPRVLDQLRDEQVVVDFGSTKKLICQIAENHPRRNQLIASHPIAGTEYSGPEAAFASLYEDKVMIVCEKERTNPVHIDTFRKQCKMLGMSTTYLDADEHDLHLAYVSHLSHVIAFSLSRTVLNKEKEADKILDLAGSGFASTVRLAKSSPEMWTPIFLKNKDYILQSLQQYIDRLSDFQAHLENSDQDQIMDFLREGRRIRKILE